MLIFDALFALAGLGVALLAVCGIYTALQEAFFPKDPKP